MKKMSFSGLLILLLMLIGLGTRGVAGRVAAATETGTPVPAKDVEIVMADGLKIKGTFYPAPDDKKAPAALLLHQLDGSRSQWISFAIPLAQKGYNVLAVDMRGHGATGGTRDWTLADSDTLALMKWLRDQPTVDPARVAVIGASIGSNLALRACASDSACHVVIALSPGLDYLGVRTKDAVADMANKSVLLVASHLDTASATAVKSLSFVIQTNVNVMVRIYAASAAHGIDMLSTKDLIPLMMQWLDTNNS